MISITCLLCAVNIEVKDETGYYRTIQAGINACPNGGTVVIYPGTYSGIGNTNLSWQNKNICLRAVYETANVIIDCQNLYNYGISLEDINQNSIIKLLKIRNTKKSGIKLTNSIPLIDHCTLESNPHGILIENEFLNETAIMQKCSFLNNSNNLDGGSGVYAIGRINISGSIFQNNQANSDYDEPNVIHGTNGAAVYCKSDQITLSDNTFLNNFGTYNGGTVTLEANPGDDSFCEVLKNKFDTNTFQYAGLGGKPAVNLAILNSNLFDNISIHYNLFVNNVADNAPSVNVYANQNASNSLNFYNNTFYNENDTNCSVNLHNQTIVIKNCAFNKPVASNTTGVIRYSHFPILNGCFPNNYNYYNITYGTFLLDANYRPIWDSQHKSYLIDNGDRDTNGNGIDWRTDNNDRDADGTIIDIGAVPAIEHGSYMIKLNNNGSSNQYNWVCFPFLDKLYTDTSDYDVDRLDYVIHSYHGNNLLSTNPRILNNIYWLENSNMHNLNYNGYFWDNANHTIKSEEGYKVTLMNNCSYKELEITGFPCGNYGNEDEFIHLNAASPSNPCENWIGYFKKQSEDPFVALSDVIDDLLMIKTKRWTISRSSLSSPWFLDSEKKTLNFGEAVILTYAGTEDRNFVLHTSDEGGIIQAYSEPEPQYFSFTEQEDYTPVYVKIDESMLSKSSNAELALYINNICYGAEIVRGDTVQINAYIADLPDSNAVMEFRYWEPGQKSAPLKFTDYAVYNTNENTYSSRPVYPIDNKPFYAVSLNKKDISSSILNSKNAIESNYPNPFNPETTIRYSIANDSHVNLSVYNVKGQLVKTLVNENQKAGFKSVIWDGKDRYGKRSASGIYFCRMQSNNQNYIHKMLLMK